jgi:choline dehydrogenase-like flavoprotein
MIGSLQTPQLLELSGIGNSSILSQHDINTIIDLPGVGENLRELFWIRVLFATVIHSKVQRIMSESLP